MRLQRVKSDGIETQAPRRPADDARQHALAFPYATAREVSDFEQTQSQPRAQGFQNPERLRCPNEHHLTATHRD